MGYDLRLKGTTITDLTAPVLPEIDMIMPRSGALMLLDPTHPENPWAGPLVNGATLPNLAYAQAKALIPAGDTTSLGGQVSIPAQWTQAVNPVGLAERTTKGGIHFMPSRTNAADSTAGGNAAVRMGVDGNSAWNAYMRSAAGLSNLYVAAWGRVTLAPLALNSGGVILHSRSDSSTQAYGFYTRPAGGSGETQYPIDGRRLGNYGEGVMPALAGTPFFQDISTKPTTTTSALWQALTVGGGASLEAAQKSPGFILYGYYVENLTVSGRTYAQVSKLVQEKYTRDVKTPGGRYYGDTFGSVA